MNIRKCELLLKIINSSVNKSLVKAETPQKLYSIIIKNYDYES